MTTSARELGEHGSLIAGAGPDVEDALVAAETEERADRCYDERLRDRLPVPDRQRAVVVGVRAQSLRYEELPRNPAHGREDPLVGDTAATELPLDHLRASGRSVDLRDHLASERSPAKRAACRPRMRAATTGSATART